MTAAVRICVAGIVQGVGFRPFVWRLAQELGIRGWVRNDAHGVEILAEGEGDAAHARLERFVERLRSEAPPLARIERVTTDVTIPTGCADFRIAATAVAAGAATTAIGPDIAVCADCLDDMFDPDNRRWRYAFTNCTNCGPRYTIIDRLPWDRPQTSMAGFIMCPHCQAEYDDPADRRFHAQPNACPHCGPRLALHAATGAAIAGDAVLQTLRLLRAGKIVAIKGLGGYHLACDATNAAAVATLRQRKHREEKPFAVMLANVASMAPYVTSGGSSAEAAALLTAAERPVVLLEKQIDCDLRLAGIAPGLDRLGVMLPHTPLQWLLFHEAAGRPAGTAWRDEAQALALVMTSANPGGEPIVRDDDEAVRRLTRETPIADAILSHDRAIVSRCDDSVLAIDALAATDRASAVCFVRRARGHAPRAIRLPHGGPAVLAVGAYLKNTLCLTRGDEAFISPHIGDLDNAPTCDLLEQTAARLMALLEIEPQIVVHDLHPDGCGTHYAARLAAARGLPRVAVQHHHAHIAAVAAEHGLTAPLLGLALDGVGLGSDGHGLWGGELLRVEGAACERLGHLREIVLPGGDRAAREPWRMAVAALHLLGRDDEAERRFPGRPVAAMRQMLARGAHCPPTSSAGRWFDAAAGLLGVCEVAAYEGQAAMRLEGLAARHGPCAPYARGFALDAAGVLDLAPLLARLADEAVGVDAGHGAALFHATLVAGLAKWTLAAVGRTGISRVAFGGGCFLNRILAAGLRRELECAGVAVYAARRVPPNDGGLALGQAWIALDTGD